MGATKIVELDIWNSDINSGVGQITAVQGEVDSRFIEIHLIDKAKSIPYDLTNKEIIFNAIKPDKFQIYNKIDVIDTLNGICVLKLTSQMSAVVGNITDCEIQIIGFLPQDFMIVKGINIEILSTIGMSNIESTSEFTALEDAISTTQDIDNRVPKTTTVNNKALINNIILTYNDVGAISISEKGVAGGVAEYDAVNTLSTKKVGNGILATMGDLAQDVKAAMTGGSVAVVGTGSTNFKSLANDLNSALGEFLDITPTIQTGYYYNSSSGALAAYAGFNSVTVPVTTGDILSVTSKVSGTGCAEVVFLNASNQVVSIVGQGTATETNYTDSVVAVPANAVIAGITSHTTNPIVERKQVVAVKDRLVAMESKAPNWNYAYDNVDTIKDAVSKPVAIGITTNTGYFYATSTGNLSTFASAIYTNIDVNYNEKYYVTFHHAGAMCGIIFKGSDGSIISKLYTDSADATLNDQEITVPNEAVLMGVSSFADTPIVVKKSTVVNVFDNVSTDNLSFENNQLKERISALQKSNDFAWKDYDKAYISFVVDDTNEFVGQFADIFINNNVPLCLAAIPSYLSNNVDTCNSGTTVKDVMTTVVNGGGEILSHNNVVITSSNTHNDTVMTNQFKCTKNILVDAGFDVNGIILAGGTDYTTADFAECVKYMRPYYRYSDLYGTGTGVVQYYHPRLHVSDYTLAQMESLVDTAITNKTWLVLFAHSFSEITSNDLNSLIAYIKTLSGVEIVTYKYLHDNFGTTALEKRIYALEHV